MVHKRYDDTEDNNDRRNDSAGKSESMEPEKENIDESAHKSSEGKIDVEIDSDEDDIVNSEEGDDPEEGEQQATEEETEERPESESERYIRLAAEFDNYKKRTAREFADVIRRANTRLLRDLVEIVDNFERALEQPISENNGEAYRQGVELIYNQLSELLRKEQVQPIEAVGKPFDPNYHEAMMQAESDEYDEGIVCQEVQKGYKIDDKVLRHARVVVSKGRPETND